MFDRVHELSRLTELASRPTPQLVLMYGRRRVGKTFLLTNAWGEHQRLFYFTAAETTPDQNRYTLVEELARFSGLDLSPDDFRTWRTVFRHIIEMESHHPIVVVLDEFQYLGGGNDATLREITSELNAVWEAARPARQCLLVLCGSSVRLLETLNASGSPLYGRFDWTCKLEPFDYWYAGEMAAFSSLRDRASAYGVFGGTPRYLAAIDGGKSLAHNIASLALAKDGGVRQLIETALLQEPGLREHPAYNAIVRAIASGRTDLNNIRQGAGLSDASATSVRDKVERLVDLGFVRAERNFEAKNTQPFRYRLSDPALTFHHHFVARNATMLEYHDPLGVFREHVRPHFDSYMGLQFEQIVLQAWIRMYKAKALPMVRDWGRWKGVDRRREPVEMDIVARLADGRMLTGGIKWSSRAIAATWHRQHIDALQRLAESGHAWAHEALQPDAVVLWVSAAGFQRDFETVVRATHSDSHCWSLTDLYE